MAVALNTYFVRNWLAGEVCARSWDGWKPARFEMGQLGFEPRTSRLSAERSYLAELLALVGAVEGNVVGRLNVSFR